MKMVEKIMQLFGHKPCAVEQMEVRSEIVSHDLTNLKARMDMLSMLVERMQKYETKKSDGF